MPYSIFDPAAIDRHAATAAELADPTQPQLESAMAPLVDGFIELLSEEHVAPCMPIGSLLPVAGGSAALALDPGADTAAKRALVFLLMVEHLPERREVQLADGKTNTVRINRAPIAALMRQGLPDFLSWQTPEWQQRLQGSDSPKLLPMALLEAVKRLVDEGDEETVALAWKALHPDDVSIHRAAVGLHALRETIDVHFRNDHYNRTHDITGASVARVTTRETAARKDVAAHRKPDATLQYRVLRQAVVDPAALVAVDDALRQPFGGRRLLAALHVKLVLNHLNLAITSTGKASPLDPLVYDVVLAVLNAVAATPPDGAPQRVELAPTAAMLGAALRLQRLTNDSDPAACVLSTLPAKLRTALPACFRRDRMHHPDAACAMARSAFEQASDGRGRLHADQIGAVSQLAHLTAALVLDWTQVGALELQAEHFQRLAQRMEDLKKGGTSGRLKTMVPDGHYRAHMVLPQMQRALTFHSFMAKAGADTLAEVRRQLHAQVGWPAVPGLARRRLTSHAGR